MLQETLNNRVYFSAILSSLCPDVYKRLASVLDRYGVPHHLLEGTKDIWCRDYMPLQSHQWNELIGYNYSPDYLHLNIKDELFITNGNLVASKLNGFKIHRGNVTIDGGNVVMCSDKAVMTAKVFEENPEWSVSKLSSWLESQLNAEVIFLPWDTTEKYGHADGICRYAGDGRLILTNYRQFDEPMTNRYRKILQQHFKEVYELRYDVTHLNVNSWAYINYLQTDKVIIVPGLCTEEDTQALEQLNILLPNYAGHIEMVDAHDVVKMGGGFNCCSWTIKEPAI